MNCPRCCLPADEAGVVQLASDDDGPTAAAVFQCPRCLVTVDLFGTPSEIAYTFARLADGRILDGSQLDDVRPGLG
jgi:hypothetical protein